MSSLTLKLRIAHDIARDIVWCMRDVIFSDILKMDIVMLEGTCRRSTSLEHGLQASVLICPVTLQASASSRHSTQQPTR